MGNLALFCCERYYSVWKRKRLTSAKYYWSSDPLMSRETILLIAHDREEVFSVNAPPVNEKNVAVWTESNVRNGD